MALTHKQLKEAEKRWSEIEKADIGPDTKKEIEKYLKDYGIAILESPNTSILKIDAQKAVRIFLQTQSSILACNDARRACFWAAIAATVAALGALIALFGTIGTWIAVAVNFILRAKG
jgi:hypothetical protein